MNSTEIVYFLKALACCAAAGLPFATIGIWLFSKVSKQLQLTFIQAGICALVAGSLWWLLFVSMILTDTYPRTGSSENSFILFIVLLFFVLYFTTLICVFGLMPFAREKAKQSSIISILFTILGGALGHFIVNFFLIVWWLSTVITSGP